MRKPTKQAMLDRLDSLQKWCFAGQSKLVIESQQCPECPCGQCKHELDAIRRLIRQTQPKVRREFVEKWAKELCGLGYWGTLSSLLFMLREAGVEVEGKVGEKK